MFYMLAAKLQDKEEKGGNTVSGKVGCAGVRAPGACPLR